MKGNSERHVKVSIPGPSRLSRVPSTAGAFASPCDADERGSLAPYFPGVVQVFTSSVDNDWDMPWSRSRPEKSTGSGWILDTANRIIVTNAHVVEFASTLQVRRESDPIKYEATVLYVAHQVDLALLTVAKSAFWRDAIELSLGSDPRIQQSVHVIGYPLGGENLSVTGGVVSRVDWSD
jgi:S1-C subfamily serine protease